MVFISGPTASGKSSTALVLAGLAAGEIISADSRMVYRHLDIGTDKPSEEERKTVRHHLIDCIEPTEEYNAGIFVRKVYELIPAIAKRSHIPIIAGGTGFYIDALIKGLCRAPQRDEKIRKKLTELAKIKGYSYLYKRLRRIDPELAKHINPADRLRIIRGLEVFELSGKNLSAWQSQKTRAFPYPFRMYYLSWNRDTLYERINKRVVRMIETGLVNETRRVRKKYGDDIPALKTVGYRQATEYLKKRISRSSMIESIQQETRNLAKRQMTWWRTHRYYKEIEMRSDKDIRKTARYIMKEFSDKYL